MKDKYQMKLNLIIVIALGVFVTSLLVLFLVLNIRQQLAQSQPNPPIQGASINGESQGKDSQGTPPESTEEEEKKFGVWEIREEELEKLLEEYNHTEEVIKKLIEQKEQEIEKLKKSQAQP